MDSVRVDWWIDDKNDLSGKLIPLVIGAGGNEETRFFAGLNVHVMTNDLGFGFSAEENTSGSFRVF